jgi:predicted metal-dependent enzyme (double-stranded beta helix superfamily)
MATQTVPYKFDDFIGDLELITSVGSPPEDKIRLIQRKLRLLIATGNFLPSEAKTPALQRYARHLVHEDPKKRFIVVSLVWTPGQGTPIHDHSTWGVAGIVENELRIVNYDRMDDGSKPGFADLREASAIEAPAGTVTYILPPNDVIHLIENPTNRTTISLHVYGQSTVECNQFDLAAKSFKPWKLTYDKPCAC